MNAIPRGELLAMREEAVSPRSMLVERGVLDYREKVRPGAGRKAGLGHAGGR